MKGILTVLIVVVMLIGLCVAQTWIADESHAQAKEAPPPSLAHLTKFVGKYPSGYEDDKNGKVVKKNGLLDDKAFRQVLMKSIGKNRFNEFLSDFSVETPIKQHGQILYVFKCEPHNCNHHNVHMFINLSDNSIESLWHTSGDEPDYWLSSKKQPRSIKKDTHRMDNRGGEWVLKAKDELEILKEFGNH
jgi:hypothetical protein